MRTHDILFDNERSRFRIIVKDDDGYWFFYHGDVDFGVKSDALTFADALNQR